MGDAGRPRQVKFVQPTADASPVAPSPPVPPPPPTPERIAELAAITDVAEFAPHLARSIRDPALGEAKLFRSPQLAGMAHTAARYLIREVDRALSADNNAKPRDKRSSGWKNRILQFKNLLEAEKAILNVVVNGLRAQDGIVGTPSNPRRRAERRLVTENMRGPLKQGRFTQIVAEEQAKDAAAKAAAKAAKQAQKEAERARRAEQGLPVAQPANRRGPRPR